MARRWLALAAALAACDGRFDGPTTGSSRDRLEDVDDFIASLERIEDGMLVAFGDLLFLDEAEARRYFAATRPTPGALARHVPGIGIHPDVRGRIVYCVSREFAPEEWAFYRGQIATALDQWSRHLRDVRFVYKPEYDASCRSHPGDVVIAFLPSGECRGGANGSDLANPDPRLVNLLPRPAVCSVAGGEAAWSRDRWLISTIAHEIGHNLGFAHEHQRADTASGCEAGGQETTATDYLTGWDPLSVMNYGGCATNTTMSISLLDAQGAQAVYGRCDNFRAQPMDRPPLAAGGQPVGSFDYDATGTVEPRWTGLYPGSAPGCPCGWESSQPACGQFGTWTCGGDACATTRVAQRQECR